MQKMNAIALQVVIALVGVVILLLCVFVLPSVAASTARLNPEVAYLHYPILFGMYATAIPFFYALVETVRIIRISAREGMFAKEIGVSLNRIKYCAFTIIGLYVAGFIVLDTANAMPPIIGVLGVVITLLTVMVATGAMFIRHVLQTNVQHEKIQY